VSSVGAERSAERGIFLGTPFNFRRARSETEGMRFLVVVLVLIALGWWLLRPSEIPRPPGVLAPDDPVQENVTDGPHFQLGEYDVHALARFELDARVLSAEHYRSDREADLAPVDLALGWGPMSSNEVLGALSISQGARFFQYSYSSAKDLPVSPAELGRHASNMHMIPLDSTTRETLLAAKRGNLVHLTGWLVEARAKDGWHWKSSLSRGDTGGGACEVVAVEHVDLR
jgi:hypothetical protein